MSTSEPTDDIDVEATDLTRDDYALDDDVETYSEPDIDADDYPEAWTPAQCRYWAAAMEDGDHWYHDLESEAARYWFRRMYRPKKRRSGGSYLMERDHVTFGTAEDYIREKVSDVFQPMGDFTSSMMRSLTGPGKLSTDVADQIINDFLQARFRDVSVQEQRRLLASHDRVANLYGV